MRADVRRALSRGIWFAPIFFVVLCLVDYTRSHDLRFLRDLVMTVVAGSLFSGLHLLVALSGLPKRPAK
jgi:hypothetical protein